MNQPNNSNQPSQVRKDRWDITYKSIWAIIGGLVLFVVLCWLLGVLALPMGILLWTVIIVFSLRGIVAALEKRRVPRIWGTTIAYVVMFVVVAGVLVLLFSPAFGFGEQFNNIVESVPGYIQAVIDWATELGKNYESLFDNETVVSWLTSAGNSLLEWATGLAKTGAQGVIDFGTMVANILVQVGFALVIAFWILLDLPAMGREAKRVVSPARHGDLDMLHITFTRVMGGYLKATLLQCTIIGVLCGILFVIIGIPNAPAMGAITGIFNILPIIGPWIGGFFAAIAGIFIAPWVAIVALCGTIVIQQFVYTFISPKIMSSSVDVHPALTLLVLMAGSSVGMFLGGLMGSLIGMFFSIPLAAVVKSLFVYYYEKKTGRCIVAEDGFFFKGKPNADGMAHPLDDASDYVNDEAGEKKRLIRRRAKSAKIARCKNDDEQCEQ